MGNTTVRSGSATVTISGLDEVIRDASRPLIPVVVDESRPRLQRILDAARRDWPVRTGRSRASLELRETQSEARVSTTIGSDVWYAGDVHPARDPRRSWDTLVVVPVLVTRRLIELALPRRLERDVQRAVGG